jgi:hypothetical protein
MAETTSVITTTATLEVSDSDIERLVEEHLRRKAGIPKEAKVSLEWRGLHCPYLHVTITHQRPAERPPVSPESRAYWSESLGSVFG